MNNLKCVNCKLLDRMQIRASVSIASLWMDDIKCLIYMQNSVLRSFHNKITFYKVEVPVWIGLGGCIISPVL